MLLEKKKNLTRFPDFHLIVSRLKKILNLFAWNLFTVHLILGGVWKLFRFKKFPFGGVTFYRVNLAFLKLFAGNIVPWRSLETSLCSTPPFRPPLIRGETPSTPGGGAAYDPRSLQRAVYDLNTITTTNNTVWTIVDLCDNSRSCLSG